VITIVGSSDLWPTPNIASAILTIMVSNDDSFAIRTKKSGEPTSMVEALVDRIATKIGCTIHTWNGTATGSGQAFTRDVAMVHASSKVFAFFMDQDTEGGTGHVVACALREGIPVVAYGLDEHGNVVEIGSDAGDTFLTQLEAAWF